MSRLSRNEAEIAVTIIYTLTVCNIALWVVNSNLKAALKKADSDLDEVLNLAQKLGEMGDYANSEKLVNDIKFLRMTRAERRVKDKDRPRGHEEA